jgi:hypothetical protein
LASGTQITATPNCSLSKKDLFVKEEELSSLEQTCGKENPKNCIMKESNPRKRSTLRRAANDKI